MIGGESIYRQLVDECDVANIQKDYAYEADAYFPNLDEKEEWEITADSEEQTYFDLEYRFLKYEKEIMLENFIYSVNVTFPIFLVMVIGWFLRQRECLMIILLI